MTADGLIAERFRLRRLLGAGGTAAVFAADDTQRGCQVALKILHPHLAADRQLWEAFFEEVRAAQSIDHVGLVEIYDAGVDASDPPSVWIAMELVDGVSLAELVHERGPLTAAAVAVLACAVLDALAAAHAGDVIHRDVTPANIMLDPSAVDAPVDSDALARSIRLLDFGLADIPGRSTHGADALLSGTGAQTDQIVASLPYASPEQLTGSAVDARSDLYQLGASMFYALTGRAPFSGDPAAVVRAHLHAPPPVPSVSRPGTPRAMDRVVATAMLKRPDERYPDAGAMRAACAELVRSAGAEPEAPASTAATRVYRTVAPTVAPAPAHVAPGPTTQPTHLPPPPARNSSGAAAWAIGAAIVVIGVGAGFAAVGAPRTPPAASTSVPTPSPTPTPTPTAVTPVPTQRVVSTASVPDVTGRPIDDARAAVEAAGLAVGEVSAVDAPVLAGLVLSTEPAAGAEVGRGTTVAVRVATGRNVVPTVTGLTGDDAVAALAAAGFGWAPDDGVDSTAGRAATTSPQAGALFAVGGTVILTISRPTAATPAPAPSSPSPAPTPSSSPLP